MLLKTAYGLKQAAMMFWKQSIKAMKHMGFERNEVDPCLYWQWTDNRLETWLSWVDDCMITGDNRHSALKVAGYLNIDTENVTYEAYPDTKR